MDCGLWTVKDIPQSHTLPVELLTHQRFRNSRPGSPGSPQWAWSGRWGKLRQHPMATGSSEPCEGRMACTAHPSPMGASCAQWLPPQAVCQGRLKKCFTNIFQRGKTDATLYITMPDQNNCHPKAKKRTGIHWERNRNRHLSFLSTGLEPQSCWWKQSLPSYRWSCPWWRLPEQQARASKSSTQTKFH